MKIFGREISFRSKTEENISCSSNSDALLFGNLLGQQYSAMNLSTVFRCVDLISDSIAVIPVKVVKEVSNGCKNELPNHSLNTVFSKSISNNLSLYQFLKMLVRSVLLKGNGYALIERAQDGTVTGLRFVESDDVQIHYDKCRKNALFYTCTLIQNKKIEPCNIIHLRKHTLDGINGRSILSFADRTIRLAQAGEQQATNIFNSGCNLAGVLKVNSTLTKEQRQNIHESWQKSMTNGGSGLAVLQGNMDYQPIQISPEDAQLLASRLFQVDEICRFFGINPVLIGELSNSSYNTLEAAQQEFLLHCLLPYIVMIEQEFTAKLFKPSERGLRVNLVEAAILRTDKTALASYYKTLLDTGVLCLNEVRKELGYNEIEGGDKHLIAYTDINQNTINKTDDGNGDETV